MNEMQWNAMKCNGVHYEEYRVWSVECGVKIINNSSNHCISGYNLAKSIIFYKFYNYW
jgi:hypothetical protein